MINPWKVLGVHRQSTDEEVRQAFHTLAWGSHPDTVRYQTASCMAARAATAKFQEYNEAYSILKDKKRTSIFIKDMIIRNKECVTCKGKGAAFKSLGIREKVFKACGTCGGAGVMISQKEETNVAIELQPSGSACRTGRHNKRKA